MAAAAVVLEIHREFDPVIWQTASRLPPGATRFLLTWQVSPPPVDAGMPEPIRPVFGEALCSLGAVLYGGDGQSGSFAGLELRRGLRRSPLALYRAATAAELLPAFESGRHDWSMSAQWLVVTRPASENAASIQALYEDWALPAAWPPGWLLIVQAAVDGDGAACFSAGRDVEDRFLQALAASALAAGFTLRIDPPPH